MAINSLLPALFFERVSQRPESMANLTMQLCESIASELIPIIGKDGFAILFARSLYLTQSTFPWLAASPGPQSVDTPPFNLLIMSLEGKEFAVTSDAVKTLLINFIDILTMLIGEQLTAGILSAVLEKKVSTLIKKEALT